MNIKDISLTYQKGLITDESGEVLCPLCKKEPAWATWEGRNIAPCWTCERPRIGVNYISKDLRSADGEEAAKGLKSSDPHERKLAAETLKKIGNETGRVRAMREELANAHRKHDKDKIKDIHETIKKNPDYK